MKFCCLLNCGSNALQCSHWYIGTISLCFRNPPDSLHLLPLLPSPESFALRQQHTVLSPCSISCSLPHPMPLFVRSYIWVRLIAILYSLALCRLTWCLLVLSMVKSYSIFTAETYPIPQLPLPFIRHWFASNFGYYKLCYFERRCTWDLLRHVFLLLLGEFLRQEFLGHRLSLFLKDF